MGCGSCGSTGGCGKQGGCSSGSCNRMNVYDWLANLPFSDPESSCRIVEVSFNNGSRKEFYRNSTNLFFSKGDMVTVEGANGFDVGMVNMTGELVRLQLKKHGIDEKNQDIKKLMRRASEFDISKMKESKAKENQMLIRSRAIARQLKLELKMAEVEIQADGRKATYFYIADDRVDFRELIKLYAAEFKVRVEMKQIGARQEAGKVGGIGSCGRELCCSTWLTEFKSVNTNAARYQNLSINQTKLSGQCGRLKCCLNYELDTYLDALQHFPNDAEYLEVQKGRAYLVKKDIFRSLMWYTLPDSNKQYPLDIETVKKIRQQNREGIRPEALEIAEVATKNPKEVEPAYADLVGQISLRNLERTSRKRRDKEKSRQQKSQQGPQGPQGRRPQQPGGSQSKDRQARGPQQGGNQPARKQQGGGNQQPRNPRQGGQRRDTPNRPPEKK